MPMLVSDKYIGNELALFEKAHHWKSYYRSFFSKYLKGSVLEVGAGIGGTTKSLCDGSQDEWICLEPDKELSQEIDQLISAGGLPACCKNVHGFIADIPASKKFDAILYIDVIEHIEDDYAEVARAGQYLKEGGVIIIIVPAHQFLYSPFDKAIGHFRRYSKKRLREVNPKGLTIETCRYLDSVGLMASFANKMLLKKQYPTAKQIAFWDNNMVPVSKFTDKLTGFSLGKSVLLVTKKG
jgi:SAM-dependent methyltransferase